MGRALRDKRGSGGDSQGLMALERVRAGPAVSRRREEKPGGGVGGRVEASAIAIIARISARPGKGCLRVKRRAGLKPF